MTNMTTKKKEKKEELGRREKNITPQTWAFSHSVGGLLHDGALVKLAATTPTTTHDLEMSNCCYERIIISPLLRYQTPLPSIIIAGGPFSFSVFFSLSRVEGRLMVSSSSSSSSYSSSFVTSAFSLLSTSGLQVERLHGWITLLELFCFHMSRKTQPPP